VSATTFQRDQLSHYRQPVDAVVAALDTEARLEGYGKNELTAEKPVPA
jgi:hypothetical protein